MTTPARYLSDLIRLTAKKSVRLRPLPQFRQPRLTRAQQLEKWARISPIVAITYGSSGDRITLYFWSGVCRRDVGGLG